MFRLLLLIPSISLSVEIERFFPKKGIGEFVPSIGTVNLLILPVQFSNVKFQQPPSYFDQLAERFKAYYLETSNGSLTIIPTVATYATLSTSSSNYASNPTQLTIDAVNVANPYINFSSYNALMLLHAGANNQSGGHILSQFWSVNIVVDGTTIYNVMIVPEKDNYRSSSFGIWCHEFGHQLGHDDLPFGYWSLMDVGCYNGSGEYPAHLDGYSKYRLGWITPEQVENLTLLLKPTSTVYKFGTGAEFFILEYRKKKGFDSFLPGEGFLAYHINEVGAKAVYPADNEWDGLGDSGDPFPGSSGRREVTFAPGFTFNLIFPAVLSVKAYPNPLMGDGFIFFDAPPKSRVRIYNVAGELVGEAKDKGYIGRFSWRPNVASGVYIFVAEDADGSRGYGKLAIIK
ncbi:MAG: T9SS type A sorting domain-containing protein [bacterium]|nr:T9SS type A sorting domain-containing protein [bacterium]